MKKRATSTHTVAARRRVHLLQNAVAPLSRSRRRIVKVYSTRLSHTEALLQRGYHLGIHEDTIN